MSATTSTFQVTGMTCGHCEMSVREEVSEIPGVQNVDVSHETGSLVVSSEHQLEDQRRCSRPSPRPDTRRLAPESVGSQSGLRPHRYRLSSPRTAREEPNACFDHPDCHLPARRISRRTCPGRGRSVDRRRSAPAGAPGASGAGKTTLIGVLRGDMKPSSGQVTLDGRNVHKLRGKDHRTFRAAVRFVSQYAMTVVEPGKPSPAVSTMPPRWPGRAVAPTRSPPPRCSRPWAWVSTSWAGA